MSHNHRKLVECDQVDIRQAKLPHVLAALALKVREFAQSVPFLDADDLAEAAAAMIRDQEEADRVLPYLVADPDCTVPEACLRYFEENPAGAEAKGLLKPIAAVLMLDEDRRIGTRHARLEHMEQAIAYGDGRLSGTQVAEMKWQLHLLRPFWGPGVTMEQAVAAYREAHAEDLREHPGGEDE
jgi:hypothetical protein